MDKKLLIGGVATLALIGGAYYYSKKSSSTSTSSPQTSALSNTASLLQTNSDATTQLLGGESAVGVTSVSGPAFTPNTVAPSLLPILKGSDPGVGGGSDTNIPYLTPQQYSTYIATGGQSY